MNTITYTTDATMKELAKKLFGYSGKTFKVVAKSSYTLNNYWDGGSKEEAVLVSRTGEIYYPNAEVNNPFKVVAHQFFDIPENHFVVTYSIVQGKDRGITFYVRPEELPNDLNPAQDELTVQAKIVLFCFRSYKSSYGNLKDYRRHEATQIIKSSEYDTAKQELLDKGLISSKNSLTTQGKNAAAPLDIWQLTQQYQQ